MLSNLIGYIVNYFQDQNKTSSTSTGTTPSSIWENSNTSTSTSVEDTTPVIEVQSWRWGPSSAEGWVETHGQIKNISNENLNNVECIVTFYDKNKTFITSDSALAEYHVLMPGQLSPFEISTRFNPEMHSAKIEFKECAKSKRYYHTNK